MAIKATIFKATLDVSDMDRNYYQSHTLTIARHPSETDERMMARVLVFALNADEHLEFTKGISSEDEPDLWRKNLTGEIDLWIDLGQPDEKRLRKACGRSQRVCVYCYSGHGAEIWWQQNADKLARFDNLSVINLPVEGVRALAALAERTMQLQCTVQEGQVWLSDPKNTVQIEPIVWK